ncbi:MAG TPA: VWA domain-containing protein [Deinococcales bacterium]|nr:VWA domain-containing protein [Deinococcales bacterium]
MIKVQLTPHRGYLRATPEGGTETQKLFLLAQLEPQVTARAPLALTFIVDTSGSMREKVAGGRNKLELVETALRGVLQSPDIGPNDQIAIVRFDDDASTLATPTSDRQRLLEAVDRLRRHSGGTMMGLGMLEGLRHSPAGAANRRALLLTDGAAFDEDACRAVTGTYAAQDVTVTSIGVGNEFNEDLLGEISDRTGGRVIHVVADRANPPASVLASDLPRVLSDVFQHAASEVVTNLEMTVRGVRGVSLDRVTRVYPFLAESELKRFEGGARAKGGNLEAGDQTAFLIEITLPPRPPARVRVAQIGMTYDVPGEGRRGEIPPIDVVVEFTFDENQTSQVNATVMGYVQQRNLENLVKQAAQEAKSNPQAAAKTIELARQMTVRLGNTAMTVALDQAKAELDQNRTIAAGTAKTIKMGAKTQTVKIGGDSPSLPSDEEIRRITGA